MSRSKKTFYFDVTKFTLPRISEQKAFNDPSIETFLSVMDSISENSARERLMQLIRPSKINIPSTSRINKHQLLSPLIIFGKKYCFELINKMPANGLNQMIQPFFYKGKISFLLATDVILYTQLIWYSSSNNPTELDLFEIKNCEFR